MNNGKSMTRREVVAAGIGLGIGGVNAADVLELSDKGHRKMKVLAINCSSRTDGIANMKKLGQNIAWLLNLLKD